MLSDAALKAMTLGPDHMRDADVAKAVRRQEKGVQRKSVRLDGRDRPAFSNIWGEDEGKPRTAEIPVHKPQGATDGPASGEAVGLTRAGGGAKSKLPVKKSFTIGSSVRGDAARALWEAWGRDREFGGGWVEQYEPGPTEAACR